MWSSAIPSRHMNCGLPPEFVFMAPASSFQHHHAEAAGVATTTINFDPYSLNGSNTIGVGVGVIPLLTATPCLAQPSIGGGDCGGGQNSPAYNLKKPIIIDQTNLIQSGGSSSMGAITCQDCGNQAKKDCPHRRCRTCCKSRNYDCATHVKSTWVPAARRRERQFVAVNAATGGSSQSTSGSKKPRLGGASQTTASHTSTPNTTPPRSFDTSSSHRDASFKDPLPGQVRLPAVFKCVRVTALDDGEDEYAYQAVVRIGGHVFKGFLYDQGFEERDSFPNISELHLGGGGGGGGSGDGVVRNGACSSSSPPVLYPTDIYAASGGGLLGGSAYGNPIN